ERLAEVAAEAHRPFDLERGPLFRAVLFTANLTAPGAPESRLRRDPHPLTPSPTRTHTRPGEGEPPLTASRGGGLPLPGERVGEREIGSTVGAPLSRGKGVRVGEGTGVRVPAKPAPERLEATGSVPLGQDRVLRLVAHHLVFDGWSLWVLLDELRRLYEGTALPPLPAGYADFVRWQEEMLAGPAGARLWDFWRAELPGGMPPLQLPVDRQAAGLGWQGAVHRFPLDPELVGHLRDLARQEGT